jgi:hypothetical protein
MRCCINDWYMWEQHHHRLVTEHFASCWQVLTDARHILLGGRPTWPLSVLQAMVTVSQSASHGFCWLWDASPATAEAPCGSLLNSSSELNTREGKIPTTIILWDFKFSWQRVWSSESSGIYCRVLNWMSTDISEVLAASETSVDIQLRTWQYIPEDSELQLQCYYF